MDDRNPANPADMTPAEMKAALPRGRRLLGLDLGSKTVGLAVADGLCMVATPLHTIRRTKFGKDAEELAAIIRKEEIGGLVLGLPVEMDGTEGKRCQSTRQFVTNLIGLGAPFDSLPISYWDERLSTAAVQRMMISEMDISRKKRAANVDKTAAAYILQGFLDAMARV